MRFSIRLLSLAVCVSAIAAAPASALIYDGSSQRVGNGPVLQYGSSTMWVAAPFMLKEDAYATSFSLAVARASGPADEGFSCWLSSDLFGHPTWQEASWKLIPTGPICKYMDAALPEPVFLKANQPYAVIVAPSSNDFMGAVSYSTRGYYGLAYDGYTWRYLAMPIGLKIDGYFVPEPSGMCAVLSGLVGVVVGLRRRL
jgi:hypothetical protein